MKHCLRPRSFSFARGTVMFFLCAGLTVTGMAQPVPGSGNVIWQKYVAPEGGTTHCVHAADALVLTGTTEGVYRSEDAGQHWRLTALNRQRVHCFLRLRDGRLLAGSDRGISASTDGGIHWRRLTEQLACTALYEDEDGRLFAGKTMRDKDTVAFYTSDDAGASWEEGASLHVYMPTRISRIFSRDSALYLVNAPMSYWQGAESANIHVSHDHGATWRGLFPFWDGRDPLDALCTSSGTLIVGGRWKGVARSTDDGSTWSVIETGFEAETQGSIWSLLELDDLTLDAPTQDMAVTAENSRVIVPLRWISRHAGSQTLGMQVSYAEEVLSLRNVTGPMLRAFDIDSVSGAETILTIDVDGRAMDTSRIFLHFDMVKQPERDPVLCRVALRPVLEYTTTPPITLCDHEMVRVYIDGVCNPIIRLSDRLQLSAYPNPGTDAVHVRYRLADTQRVQLRVLDHAGREVFQRHSENQSSGDHEVVIHTTRWPTGAYRIVLLAGAAAAHTSLSIVR